MTDILIQLVMLAAGFALLVKGADFFVEGCAGMAAKLGIPQLVIGLTIVAMGTSAPEAAVSISSAFRGSADITIGNILGSNILNILIILGFTAVISTLKVARSTVNYEIPFMAGISVLLPVLGCPDGYISFLDAIILWFFFLIYLTYLFLMSKNKPASEDDGEGILKPLPLLLILAAAGVVMIVLGSNLAVSGATGLATLMGISERIIGLTIVALGTSLPELFTSVVAARRGQADLAIGNIVGSNIFNILFVVGTAGLITPVAFSRSFFFDAVVAVLSAVLLYLGVRKNRELRRPLGIIMLLAYAAYFVYIAGLVPQVRF